MHRNRKERPSFHPYAKRTLSLRSWAWVRHQKMKNVWKTARITKPRHLWWIAPCQALWSYSIPRLCLASPLSFLLIAAPFCLALCPLLWFCPFATPLPPTPSFSFCLPLSLFSPVSLPSFLSPFNLQILQWRTGKWAPWKPGTKPSHYTANWFWPYATLLSPANPLPIMHLTSPVCLQKNKKTEHTQTPPYFSR